MIAFLVVVHYYIVSRYMVVRFQLEKTISTVMTNNSTNINKNYINIIDHKSGHDM